MTSGARALRVVPITAGVVACAVPLAIALQHLVPWEDRPRVPLGLVVALIMLVYGVGCYRVAVRIGGPLAPVLAYLAAATSATVFVHNARSALAFELSYGHASGLDSLEVEVIAPWVAFIALLGGSAAWLLLRKRTAASIACASRIAAFVFLAAGAIAVAFGAARAARLPGPEDYVASLPLVGTLREVKGIDSDPTRASWPNEDVEIDGIFTRRRCVPGNGCSIQIVTRREDLSDGHAAGHEWFIPGVMRTIAIRRDVRHGLVVVETSEPWRMWLDDRTAQWGNPALDVWAMGPPRRWVLGGLLGLVIAAVALAHRPAAVRTAALVAHARVGHSDGVRVTFEDGTPPFDLPATHAQPPRGPVLVLPDERPVSPSFRETGAIHAARVFAGTRAEHVDRANAALAARASYAIAAVALTCAPLFAG